ncbi:hypothetical protein SOASR031_22970 [Leminorella grimontii]|nr:hypothetical protein SOASR031_22970 [Leminorella grimontii]
MELTCTLSVLAQPESAPTNRKTAIVRQDIVYLPFYQGSYLFRQQRYSSGFIKNDRFLSESVRYMAPKRKHQTLSGVEIKNFS